MPESVDCAVIGAGPAGLVGALYLLRFRRSVLIADKGDSRAALIPRSHNYPGFPRGVHGKTLLGRLRRQLGRYGSPASGGEALALDRQGDRWRLTLPDREVFARRILFATGVVDRWPKLLNAQKAIDDAVLRFCPICDGFEARQDRIAVLGGDDHAAREALFVRTYSPSISLLASNFELNPDMAARLAAKGIERIAIQDGSLHYSDRAIHGVQADGRRLEPFAIAYGALGVDPQTRLLAQLGASIEAGGCVNVDGKQQTSLPGVYAASDMVRGLHQISVAMGEAAVAATDIHNSLRDEDG